MELAELVVRPARGRSAREPVTGVPRLRDGLRPLTAHLQDLGPVDEALAPEGNEILLGVAPALQRRRPLLRSGTVEGALAREEHGAVDETGGDRRHLADRDGDHRLVEERHTLRDLPERDQRLAATQAAEGQHVPVVEALAELVHPAERLQGARRIAGRQGSQRNRDEQQPDLRTVDPRLVHESPGAREPTAAAGGLALEEERQAEPERAARGSGPISRVEPGAIRATPEDLALVVLPGEVRGESGTLEVGGPDAGIPAQRRELGERLAPLLPPTCFPAPNERTARQRARPPFRHRAD
jgi:hypothetical protein